MKRINSFLVVLLLLLISLPYTAKAGEPQTLSGSKAMYVSINSLTDLSFDDTYLGGMYFFADRQAINAEIGFLSSNSENTNGSSTSEANVSSFYVSVGYMNYIFQKGPVAFYLNPYVGFSTGNNEITGAETTGFDAGVGIGSEWWAFDNVSLGVDVSLGYSTVKTEYTGTDSEQTSSDFGIIPGGGRFYLTFYF